MAAKKKAQGGEEAGGAYTDTVNLPQTSFEMRANAVVKEPQIQKLWEERRVVQTLLETNPGPPFTLHDGPPYANGDLHIGHAMNKILKDFVNRYQMLQGRKVNYIPGWDCHGLPIELKVLQSMDSEARKALTPITLRAQAAEFALQTVDKQRESFKRYGVWGDWEHPYLTLQPEYEAAQIGVFGKMVVNGHIYRGRKPVHWSPSSRTALAEAELEYPENHTSRSVYVAFPLTHLPPTLPAPLHDLLPHLSLAIWTTTPWTMPANAAVAVNEKLKYAVVQIHPQPPTPDQPQPPPQFGKGERNPGSALQSGSAVQYLVVAEELVPTLAAKLRVGLTVRGSFLGGELEHARYKHPLFERESPVVVGGDYITVESGTGLVHTAPGHGQEDYQTGLKYGLPLLSPVDDAGNFTEEAGVFEGKNVLGEGNVAVIAALEEQGALLLEEAYRHKYPYDWRTKKPTIFRATEQWFASVEGFRAQALDAISQVAWVPPQGEKRIVGMTVGRADWCISRQRSWGVPIPVFYHIDTGEPLMTEATIAFVQGVVRVHGTDAWFGWEVEDLLPHALRGQAGEYRKGTDTMDVWFDSGCSWAAVLEQRGGVGAPAQLYLEGSDQHRGWFQSSLLTSVAANGRAPYERVLTHGFVLDERGMKMSKSVGNVVDPRTIIEGGKNQKTEPPYGADVLRLWVSSVDYSGDVLIGPTIMRQMSDTYRKLRGTLRFLLGNLADFNPEEHAVPYDDLPATDRYMLWRLSGLMEEVRDSYETFQFCKFNQILQRFVIVDLSNFYFDICKDRLYIGASDSFTRRSCQTVLCEQLLCLVRAMAPVLPHMAEDAWQSLPFKTPTTPDTVFQALWPSVSPHWASFPPADVSLWANLLAVRAEVNKVVEAARVGKLVGANMDAKVYLHTLDAEVADGLRPMGGSSGEGVDRLRYILLASQVEVMETREEAEAVGAPYSGVGVLPGGGKLWVGVGRAEGSKCDRCWNYSTQVGSAVQHPTLCERCLPVVSSLPAKAPVAA